jgi:hypothetical protein
MEEYLTIVNYDCKTFIVRATGMFTIPSKNIFVCFSKKKLSAEKDNGKKARYTLC